MLHFDCYWHNTKLVCKCCKIRPFSVRKWSCCPQDPPWWKPKHNQTVHDDNLYWALHVHTGFGQWPWPVSRSCKEWSNINILSTYILPPLLLWMPPFNFCILCIYYTCFALLRNIFSNASQLSNFAIIRLLCLDERCKQSTTKKKGHDFKNKAMQQKSHIQNNTGQANTIKFKCRNKKSYKLSKTFYFFDLCHSFHIGRC